MTRNLNFIKIGIISIGILGVAFVLFIFLSNFSFSNPEITISKTFTIGDIPTSYKNYDSTCNNFAILEFKLPSADSTYEVTGIDIYYSMAAMGMGKKSEQRSQVKFLNTNTAETKIYSGRDSSAGNMDYTRNAVNIANGIYQSGTNLKFAMQAWRTLEGIPGCNTAVNRVNASSWTITLHYIPIANNQYKESEQGSKKGLLPPKLTCAERNSINAPSAGLIIWCSNCGQNGELQIYNGSKWNALIMQAASDSIAAQKRTVTLTPDATRNSSESRKIKLRELSADTIVGIN